MRAEHNESVPAPRKGDGGKAIVALAAPSSGDQPVRDRGGRFVKGAPSPNPKGAPKKPALGPLNERMSRKRTWRTGAERIVESDRDHLDRVVRNAALGGDAKAIKLWEERQRIDGERAALRQALEKEQRRHARLKELGLAAYSDSVEREEREASHTRMHQVMLTLLGNLSELRDRLVALGVISIVREKVIIANWLEQPSND